MGSWGSKPKKKGLNVIPGLIIFDECPEDRMNAVDQVLIF